MNFSEAIFVDTCEEDQFYILIGIGWLIIRKANHLFSLAIHEPSAKLKHVVHVGACDH